MTEKEAITEPIVISRSCKNCHRASVCVLLRGVTRVNLDGFDPKDAPINIEALAQICKLYLDTSSFVNIVEDAPDRIPEPPICICGHRLSDHRMDEAMGEEWGGECWKEISYGRRCACEKFEAEVPETVVLDDPIGDLEHDIARAELQTREVEKGP